MQNILIGVRNNGRAPFNAESKIKSGSNLHQVTPKRLT